MTTINSIHGASHAPLPTVRRIDGGDLRWALTEGWRDFRAKRGDLIFAGLIYTAIGIAAAMLALDDRLLPLVFPLGAGLSILGPVVAAGFYELARRRELGIDAGWGHFLDPLNGRNPAGLVMLALGLIVLFLAWLAAAWGLYHGTLGRLHPVGIRAFLAALFGTGEGWTMIVVGNLVGLGFAAATLVLTVVAAPMLVDQPVDALTAVESSLKAARANPGAIARWGLWVAVLLVLGAIPAFIGLAVVLPVLGYATWHLYTRLIER